jgi:phosphate transport system permease protein
MAQSPLNAHTPTPSADPELLRAQIKRRKTADLAFAILGVALVGLSLSVLVVLFGQLIRDGTKRLASNHEVTPSGYAPGRFELVGTLRKKDDAGATQWFLHRDAHMLVFPDAPPVDQLKPLDGKPVIVDGDPSSEQRTIEVSSVKAASSPTPEKHARDLIHGTLMSEGGQWRLEPSPMPLDTSGVEGDFASLAGQRVAVDPGRGRTVPLALRSIEKLVSQGFFNSMPSRDADRAGIKSAIVGSILVVGVTMLLAVPLGVAAGLYLEEYGRKNWLTALIEINIANLAGVPSIIWGLMALGLFVYQFGFGRSVLTAGLTLGLLVLPIVIMATREAVRAIPLAIREASYACGASKWQTVRYHIIPYSMGGILTGSIIGLSRAIGETAPLITIGALTYIAFLPDFSWSSPLAWLKSEFTVLPIQMFNWISRPDKAFHENAAAAGMVLLVLTLTMNAVAIVLRYRLRKRIKW